jgi:dihydroxyacetone kinase-like protein
MGLLVIINGSGSTTLMELWILFRAVSRILKAKKDRPCAQRGRRIYHPQKLAGSQIMIARMDPELARLWDAPSNAPYFVTK